MKRPFLRNAWYVAAWDSEVKADELFQRTLLNESVLLFRNDRGEVQAVSNRCPHRFAPLHLGKKLPNGVQCPYHGLEFDGNGQCTRNPHGGGVVPKAAQLKTYPVVEKYSLIWIWMGEASIADSSKIPDFSCLDPQLSHVAKRYLHVKANYVLETDNILDLSHIQYLHPGTLGSSSVADAITSVVQEGNTVYSMRQTVGDIMPEFLYRQRRIPVGTPVDRWIDVRWDAPAHMLLDAGSVATGKPRSEGVSNKIAHIFSPETASTTHYWFAVSNPLSMGDDGMQRAEDFVSGLVHPFQNEDLPMLEAQQHMIGEADFWSLKPVLLAGDAAAVRARRILDKLLADEEATMQTINFAAHPAAESLKAQ
ncbi:aromatic ring-hydroxylating dioxygenase subunit alpha [Burkholderia ambifaria]|uniref:aromatic ring-hydroxylating dioxygenase subunit alpha n=1 Tax=Burkholderia ambifaria TaxID=152480 RepID=UPI001E5BE24D|nr:aromatic ring-hydroxylating dioxygenase subunit alpha [Burkholderia ambifaria]UEP24498.1 aromatic ring-hydroxylating dioxygenase subunit alpha [Burkholderia ambifaria]WAS57629.1 aromatic ring-hydroxylating dioxygenase subunit alpha [Burkholderia ambifaria]WDR87222.1 aromatic ring-hydroxylating dioxygenase subunit alpha [Burkholderia ambifaria]WDR99916.1 aromatic ring-hydroxylating dioxygenase subunit alpha [Burkholderia ambifaria]